MTEIFTLRALTDNFVYALGDGTRAAVVDPGEAAPVRAFLESRKLVLEHILLTHHHPDHVAGADELARRFGAEVICSDLDLARIPAATRGVTDGDTLNILGTKTRVIATPGHTRGHVAYHFARERAVFVGDTLFSAGCGRLFEGTADEMFASIERLKRLPDDTRIFFGHEYTLNNLSFVKNYAEDAWRNEIAAFEEERCSALGAGRPTTPTTLAVERRINPFVRAADPREFAEWRTRRDHW